MDTQRKRRPLFKLGGILRPNLTPGWYPGLPTCSECILDLLSFRYVLLISETVSIWMYTTNPTFLLGEYRYRFYLANLMHYSSMRQSFQSFVASIHNIHS